MKIVFAYETSGIFSQKEIEFDDKIVVLFNGKQYAIKPTIHGLQMTGEK